MLWNPLKRQPAPESKVQAMPAPKTEPVKVGVSISRKINLGNYESAEVWVSLTGVEAGTTAAEIQAALATGALAYEALKPALVEKVREQRRLIGEKA